MQELKTYRGVMCNDIKKWWKTWSGIDLSFQNWNEEYDKHWPDQSQKSQKFEVSKIFTLLDSFWVKYILLELKRYRWVIFHDTDEWCKIWRRTDLWLGKWLEEFDKFSPEHSKVSKFGLWWDPFTQSRKCMSLKFTENNDAKFGEKLTWSFKFDMRHLTNVDSST